MLRIVSAAVAAILCCTPALAQEDTCPEASVIAWLGGMILDQRTVLPKLMARGYGAEAAYLTVRYSPELSPESIEAFLTPLLQEDIRGIKDVVFAWTAVNKGVAGANGVFGAGEVENLVLSSPTTIRALLAADAEETVIDAFGARGDEGDVVAARAIAIALLDLPDERKAKLASLAEERGHFIVAGAIYATMRDAAAWPAFLARVPHGLGEPLGNMFVYFPLYVGNSAQSPDVSNPKLWAEMQEVAAAGVWQPQIDFINTYLNQTGYIDSALAASRALRNAVANGSFPHDGPMDAGWLIAYRVLKEAGEEPAAGIDQTLVGLMVGQRPERETSAEVLSWMLAVEALRPYLRGETEALPPAPAGPGGTLAAEWPDWLKFAELVRNDPHSINPGDDGRALAMVTELLFAAGHYQTIAAMLGTLGPSRTSVGLAADFAMRLDRQCESYLWHPAEALALAGEPIYKFDDLGAGFEIAALSSPTAEPPDGAEAAPDRMKN